jgi:hypothetical protein
MGTPHTTAATPQSIDPGSVISSAIAIYRDQAAILIGSAAVVFVVTGILAFVLGPVGAIIGFVGSLFYQGMVVELVRDVQDGRRDSSVGQLFSSVAPVVLPLLAVSILAAIGIAIGFVLIIIPGLFLMTIWSVVIPVVVIERTGVFRAFGRSQELVKSYGWQVFGVIVVVILLALVLAILVALIASGLSDSARAVVQFVINIITAPLQALLVSVLYFGLRRAHGEDRSRLAADPAAGAPGPWEPPAQTQPPAAGPEAPASSPPPPPPPPPSGPANP